MLKWWRMLQVDLDLNIDRVYGCDSWINIIINVKDMEEFQKVETWLFSLTTPTTGKFYASINGPNFSQDYEDDECGRVITSF